jgi:hypothetical protein
MGGGISSLCGEHDLDMCNKEKKIYPVEVATCKDKKSHYRERRNSDSDGREIDINLLFTALLKLSFIFDLKESLTKRLIAIIIDPKYSDFTDQYVAVEKWVNNYADTNLECEEICHLISYVKLYDNEGSDAASPVRGTSRSSISPSVSVVNRIDECCRLVCPFRCELASWTAEVRHQELVRTSRMSSANVLLDSTTRVENALDDEVTMTRIDAACFIVM